MKGVSLRVLTFEFSRRVSRLNAPFWLGLELGCGDGLAGFRAWGLELIWSLTSFKGFFNGLYMIPHPH